MNNPAEDAIDRLRKTVAIGTRRPDSVIDDDLLTALSELTRRKRVIDDLSKMLGSLTHSVLTTSGDVEAQKLARRSRHLLVQLGLSGVRVDDEPPEFVPQTPALTPIEGYLLCELFRIGDYVPIQGKRWPVANLRQLAARDLVWLAGDEAITAGITRAGRRAIGLSANAR